MSRGLGADPEVTSKHHFNFFAKPQIVMDSRQLFDAGCGNPNGYGLESTFAAGVDGNPGLIEAWSMALHHFDDEVVHIMVRVPQYFDGVVFTGKFNFWGLLFGHKKAPGAIGKNGFN